MLKQICRIIVSDEIGKICEANFEMPYTTNQAFVAAVNEKVQDLLDSYGPLYISELEFTTLDADLDDALRTIIRAIDDHTHSIDDEEDEG